MLPWKLTEISFLSFKFFNPQMQPKYIMNILLNSLKIVNNYLKTVNPTSHIDNMHQKKNYTLEK